MSSLNDPSIWRFPRKKKKNIILSIVYKIFIAIPLRKKTKFELFSNLSWIFKRMAYEFFRMEEMDKHIPYNVRNKFIKDKLNKKVDVIDLGCGTGDDCRFVAPYVNSVTGVDYDKNKIDIAGSLTFEKNVTYTNKEVFEWLSSLNKKY